MKRAALLAALTPLALVVATPAVAQSDGAGNAVRARQAGSVAVPAQLDPQQRAAYRAIFADLDAGNWTGAREKLDALREGPLHDLARAELYTRRGSPEVEVAPLLTLLARAPDLPQAPAMAGLARRRGATALPSLPDQQRMVGLGGQPRRQRPRGVRGDRLRDQLDAIIAPLLVDDKPAEAEAILLERGADLTPAGRVELLQKISWTYYREGFSREALRVAAEPRRADGDWAVQAEWIAGLAAWQLGDCNGAENAFAAVARRTSDTELAAAGHYWASRAATRCGRPDRVQAYLRRAAGEEETFYGLLAESALGLRRRPAGEANVLTPRDWETISRRPNARAAIAASEAGETSLADSLIRHQARIGPADEHAALVCLSAHLNLPALQMYLGHNGPRGARVDRHARYPAPDWRPATDGWRVDQALAYAHALLESNFRPDAVSPANARGLMQVLPGTARDLVRWGRTGASSAQLNDPATNLAFGQAYLSYLSGLQGTEGLLPRVIAAYNAGPAPINLWKAEDTGRGDPLLFIESIPYWETRAYLPIILRNYWMYEYAPADRSASRQALAQGLWPRFPGLPGPTAVRLRSGAVVAEADADQ